MERYEVLLPKFCCIGEKPRVFAEPELQVEWYLLNPHPKKHCAYGKIIIRYHSNTIKAPLAYICNFNPCHVQRAGMPDIPTTGLHVLILSTITRSTWTQGPAKAQECPPSPHLPPEEMGMPAWTHSVKRTDLWKVGGEKSGHLTTLSKFPNQTSRQKDCAIGFV